LRDCVQYVVFHPTQADEDAKGGGDADETDSISSRGSSSLGHLFENDVQPVWSALFPGARFNLRRASIPAIDANRMQQCALTLNGIPGFLAIYNTAHKTTLLAVPCKEFETDSIGIIEKFPLYIKDQKLFAVNAKPISAPRIGSLVLAETKTASSAAAVLPALEQIQRNIVFFQLVHARSVECIIFTTTRNHVKRIRVLLEQHGAALPDVKALFDKNQFWLYHSGANLFCFTNKELTQFLSDWSLMKREQERDEKIKRLESVVEDDLLARAEDKAEADKRQVEDKAEADKRQAEADKRQADLESKFESLRVEDAEFKAEAQKQIAELTELVRKSAGAK
jgi:hypothetical protein